MKEPKYKTIFSSTIRPLVPEEKDKYLALASLVVGPTWATEQASERTAGGLAILPERPAPLVELNEPFLQFAVRRVCQSSYVF